MFDGIETERAAVDDRFLIQRLNISTPFSTTDGEVRYDQRLRVALYKGLHLTGVPRGNCNAWSDRGRYWFGLRGSLIKVANNGLHNNDFKDPFEILYALDDVVTQLRIDPFTTPLNGLELSATIQAANPGHILSNLVSYLNHPPNLKTINRDGVRLPYAEVVAGQHKLKLYEPVAGALRVEVKIDKMQYLGPDRPVTFADLVQPNYTASLSAKLLTAFKKIVWKYANLNVDSLSAPERELYLCGRAYEYWQVRRQDYPTDAEFKCAEKQRSREKNTFNEIVRRHWLHEPPAELEQRIREQLDHYVDLMHTPLYKTVLDICLDRWHYVVNLPGVDRLPNHFKLPLLSEIYPLYFGRFPTTPDNVPADAKSHPAKRRQSANDLRDQPERIAEILQGHKSRSNKSSHAQPTREEQAHKRQWNQASNAPNNELRRIRKAINAPGGLLCSVDKLKSLLSAKTRIALAYCGRSLEGLNRANGRQPVVRNTLPLFCT